MNSEGTFIYRARKYAPPLLAGAGLIFVIVFSLATLTTKPKISTDEAVSIELAHNFQNFGVLDIETAPAVFSGLGDRLQSTGYPVTIPLALFFKLFGYGFEQARIYMLFWMIGTLLALLWFGRALFGVKNSLLAFFLTITFASFYANGRTVVGEIPGFLFLLAGLYFIESGRNTSSPRGADKQTENFIFSRQRFLLAGLFFGLAVVSKLSVFGLIIPTIVITCLFEWRKFFQVVFPVALGMLPAGILWIFLNLNHPFLLSTWTNLLHFYQNPYGSSVSLSTSPNMAANIISSFHSITIIYFALLFLVIAVVRFKRDNDRKNFYDFVLVYGVLAFLYYLRSPGWLRYILIAELLILFLLPHAISLFCRRFVNKDWKFIRRIPAQPAAAGLGGIGRAEFISSHAVPVIVVAILIIVQFSQMFTVGKLFSSDGAITAARSVNENFQGKSVGVLNSVEVAIWLHTPERYLAMDLSGLPQIGANPLLLKNLPNIIVSYPNQRFLIEARGVVDSDYGIFGTVGGYTIYERKK